MASAGQRNGDRRAVVEAGAEVSCHEGTAGGSEDRRSRRGAPARPERSLAEPDDRHHCRRRPPSPRRRRGRRATRRQNSMHERHDERSSTRRSLAAASSPGRAPGSRRRTRPRIDVARDECRHRGSRSGIAAATWTSQARKMPGKTTRRHPCAHRCWSATHSASFGPAAVRLAPHRLNLPAPGHRHPGGVTPVGEDGEAGEHRRPDSDDDPGLAGGQPAPPRATLPAWTSQ